MNLKNFKDAQSLLGKYVYFTAMCELFPKSGIKGKVVGLEYSKSNELLYIVSINGKQYSVGSNTRGLTVEMLQMNCK